MNPERGRILLPNNLLPNNTNIYSGVDVCVIWQQIILQRFKIQIIWFPNNLKIDIIANNRPAVSTPIVEVDTDQNATATEFQSGKAHSGLKNLTQIWFQLSKVWTWLVTVAYLLHEQHLIIFEEPSILVEYSVYTADGLMCLLVLQPNVAQFDDYPRLTVLNPNDFICMTFVPWSRKLRQTEGSDTKDRLLQISRGYIELWYFAHLQYMARTRQASKSYIKANELLTGCHLV